MVLRNVLRDVLTDPIEDPLNRFVAAQILGASFDGTNDLLLRGSDLTGNVAGKTGIIATRIRFNGGDAANQYIMQSTGSGIAFIRTTGNKIRFSAENGAGTSIMLFETVSSVVVADGYVNVLLAWDLATATIQMYLNDSSDISITTNLNQDIAYSRSDHSIGAAVGTTLKMNGDINFMYANYAETIDLSVEANRRKFFDAGGNVVDMGTDGSTPTGTAPIIFQQGLYDQWHTNKGGGGGFTVTGELTQPVD